MPEEIIFCPSCGHKLRVPEELLGQVVQCPRCQLVFTAPVRASQRPVPPTGVPLGPRPQPSTQPQVPVDLGDLRERVWTALKPAGLGLLVMSTLTLVWDVYQFMAIRRDPARAVADLQTVYQNMGIRVDDQTLHSLLMTTSAVMLALLVPLKLGAILGAVQILKMQRYWLAVAGSFLALVNFLDCPCCLASLPFSLWALIVLLRPEVRQAFE